MPPSPSDNFTVMQDILDGRECSSRLPTVKITESDITKDNLLANFSHAPSLGISPGYSQNGRLRALAITDGRSCCIVEFTEPKHRDNKRPQADKTALPKDVVDGRKYLQDIVLCRNEGNIFAFDMAPLAMSLFCDLGVRIAGAVDIQSAFSVVDRKPLSAIEESLGAKTDIDSPQKIKINPENVKRLFLHPSYDPQDRNTMVDLAVRAWVSQFLSGYQNGEETFGKVRKIDTKKLSSERLDMIAKIANDSLRLDQKKPGEITHQVTQSFDPVNDGVRLTSTHYATKIRRDRDVKMKITGQHGDFFVKAGVQGVSGRSGNLKTDRVLTNKAITCVTSIGRDDPTTAEALRAATVLRILQGHDDLLDASPWIQNIWFPGDTGLLLWPKEWSSTTKTPIKAPPPSNLKLLSLNSSQQQAVNTMLSDADDHRIVLVQGPPGTGKTTVIANFIQFAVCIQRKGGIWLVAQSNVAVKNIAEKLIKCNFLDWKLLVSKDFHFEWHEHLYTKVSQNIVRSDQFNFASGKSKLQGIQVVLCTLSMLSNPQITKFTREIPLKTLVIDEASQIEIGDYVAVFSKFKDSLRKTCFIGDDKQLPPYGQEELQDLQSIFEINHLRKHMIFLDTQYRMPPQIGRIISKTVYDNKLKSNDLHEIQDNVTACYFMDISGKEKAIEGGSYSNDLECQTVLHLARKLQEQQKNYRIITPYEGQRSLIEHSLKDEGLEWGDKCFNVDSFQGNEEDYIVISLVRSRALGFLNNLRRTNVMLTRCKKGMFIISSRKFLQENGAKSLVANFLEEIDPAVWLTLEDIEKENF